MPLIEWNDNLSVGIDSIDKQHQQLVAMINKLHEAMKLGKGKEIVGSIIDEMIGYAGQHFKTEEEYFDRYQYPSAGAHKKEHADFARTVTEYWQEFEKSKLGLSVYVMNFLSDWLQQHIKNSDKQYSPFLTGLGVH